MSLNKYISNSDTVIDIVEVIADQIEIKDIDDLTKELKIYFEDSWNKKFSFVIENEEMDELEIHIEVNEYGNTDIYFDGFYLDITDNEDLSNPELVVSFLDKNIDFIFKEHLKTNNNNETTN